MPCRVRCARVKRLAVSHLSRQVMTEWLVALHVCAPHHKCMIQYTVLAAVHKSPHVLYMMHISSLRHNGVLLYTL